MLDSKIIQRLLTSDYFNRKGIFNVKQRYPTSSCLKRDNQPLYIMKTLPLFIIVCLFTCICQAQDKDNYTKHNLITLYHDHESHELVIDLKKHGHPEIDQLLLFDRSGNEVKRIPLNDGSEVKISVEGMEKGMYIFHLLNNNQLVDWGRLII